MSLGDSYHRREHAGGAPRVERSQEQWISTCDFPYEVLHDFAHEEPKEYPIEKFNNALIDICMWLTNEGRCRSGVPQADVPSVAPRWIRRRTGQTARPR